MANQSNQENTSFYDQADGKFDKTVQKKQIDEKEVLEKMEKEGEASLASPAERQVRETEDASLQDDTYSFDEENTDNEEYHDASDADEVDLDNDDDFVQ